MYHIYRVNHAEFDTIPPPSVHCVQQPGGQHGQVVQRIQKVHGNVILATPLIHQQHPAGGAQYVHKCVIHELDDPHVVLAVLHHLKSAAEPTVPQQCTRDEL